MLQILLAAHEIKDLPGLRIVEQAVDRKIAPQCVLLGRAENDRVGMAAVAIGRILPEGGHFDRAGWPSSEHRNHAERFADGSGPLLAEKRADFGRSRTGCHVIVLGSAPEQLIAHAPAGPVSVVAGGAQALDHFDGKPALGDRIVLGSQLRAPGKLVAARDSRAYALDSSLRRQPVPRAVPCQPRGACRRRASMMAGGRFFGYAGHP